MSDIVKKNQSWAVEIEDNEGEYKAPTSGASFVQTLADGAEMSRSREEIERNVFTSSIGKTNPRTGMFEVSGSLPVEYRAASTEGDAPEFDVLIQSAMGDTHTVDEVTSDDDTHTTTRIFIEDADQNYQVNDIVMIKEAGKFHVSPISAVTATYIDLLVEMPEAPTAEVVVSKSTMYTLTDSAHPSLSISRYLEDAVVQKAVGCKVASMSLENFSTGQIPSLNFAFEGLNFDSELQATPHSPTYSQQLPPIILDARVMMDGEIIDVNEISFSLENTLGFRTSVNAENGRQASRATERVITGELNPYMKSDSMANFNKFKNNTAFSIFGYAKLPSSTAGEFGGVVAFYLPNCVITDLGESDQDEILQDSISFSANRGPSGTIQELYMAFI
jgi:hypothetical protein